jgi:WD40 repeat protein
LAWFNLAEKKLLAELSDISRFRGILAVQFMPDSRSVCVADLNGDVFRWDPSQNGAAGKYVAEWRNDAERGPSPAPARTEHAVFSPDGRFLVTSHRSTYSTRAPSALVFWDNELGQPIRVLRNEPVYGLAVSADGRLLAGFEQDVSGGTPTSDTIRIWNLNSGQELFRLQPSDARATSMAFSPDSKQLLTGFDRGTFAIWDVQ